MAHGSCNFFVVRSPAGGEVITFTSDAPLRDCGEWWSRPETVSLRAALTATLVAAAVLPVSYAMDDVLVTHIEPALEVALRCAAASDQRDLSRQQWLPRDPAYLHDTDAALLTHTFDAFDGERVLRVALRTLLAPRSSSSPLRAIQLQSVALRVPIALPAATRDDALASEVAIDGAPLVPEDVRLLPTARRAALKACRSAQLLHAAAACIDSRWLGGLRLLRGAVQPLLARRDPAAAEAYAKLLADIDAMPTRPREDALTPPDVGARCQSMVREAEALEAQGRFTQAAQLYRNALPLAQNDPSFPNVAMLCAFLGIALRHGGDVACARRAYERGISMLAAPAGPGAHVMVHDTPAARESMRLYLLRRLVVSADGDVNAQAPYLERAFKPVRDQLRLRPGDQLAYDMPDGTDGAFTMEQMATGRRWGIVYDDDSSPQVRAAAAVSGGISYKIAELPRAGASANLNLVTNAEDMRRWSSRAAVAMPSLARSCIACGATPDKLRICGACKQVAYCSKEVRALLAGACRFQRLLLRLHILACRAV